MSKLCVGFSYELSGVPQNTYYLECDEGDWSTQLIERIGSETHEPNAVRMSNYIRANRVYMSPDAGVTWGIAGVQVPGDVQAALYGDYGWMAGQYGTVFRRSPTPFGPWLDGATVGYPYKYDVDPATGVVHLLQSSGNLLKYQRSGDLGVTLDTAQTIADQTPGSVEIKPGIDEGYTADGWFLPTWDNCNSVTYAPTFRKVAVVGRGDCIVIATLTGYSDGHYDDNSRGLFTTLHDPPPPGFEGTPCPIWGTAWPHWVDVGDYEGANDVVAGGFVTRIYWGELHISVAVSLDGGQTFDVVPVITNTGSYAFGGQARASRYGHGPGCNGAPCLTWDSIGLGGEWRPYYYRIAVGLTGDTATVYATCYRTVLQYDDYSPPEWEQPVGLPYWKIMLHGYGDYTKPAFPMNCGIAAFTRDVNDTGQPFQPSSWLGEVTDILDGGNFSAYTSPDGSWHKLLYCRGGDSGYGNLIDHGTQEIVATLPIYGSGPTRVVPAFRGSWDTIYRGGNYSYWW